MSLVHIVFPDRADEARGLVELARRVRIDAFRAGLYAVPERDLQRLDELGIGYRLATTEEVAQARQAVRHPAAASVQ